MFLLLRRWVYLASLCRLGTGTATAILCRQLATFCFLLFSSRSSPFPFTLFTLPSPLVYNFQKTISYATVLAVKDYTNSFRVANSF